MDNLSLITAFTTGLLTFFAPCTFVALPSFIAYLTSRVSSPNSEGTTGIRSEIVISALMYALGFLLVFTLLGLTATTLGNLFLQNKELFSRIGGALMVAGGLFMIFGSRFRSLQFLYQEQRFEVKDGNKYINGYLFPFTIGLTTALAWTPCVGPVLGAILLLASANSDNPLYGGLLLFVHGLGIMIPFMVIALLFERATWLIQKIGKYSDIIYKISAIVIILLGLSLLFGAYDLVGQEMYKIYTGLGFKPL